MKYRELLEIFVSASGGPLVKGVNIRFEVKISSGVVDKRENHVKVHLISITSRDGVEHSTPVFIDHSSESSAVKMGIDDLIEDACRRMLFNIANYGMMKAREDAIICYRNLDEAIFHRKPFSIFPLLPKDCIDEDDNV